MARGLADDAAVFGDLVLTHDMMIAGVHYPHQADPADVAWKLLAANLSDLAAKGAAPLGVLLGFMIGDDDWDRAFVAGLAEALVHYKVGLWGGDTVAASADRPGSARAIGLTAIGRAAHVPPPSRSGARPGDRLWMTGTIGDAMLGFTAETGQIATTAAPAARARFRRPVPRIAEGQALAPLATAMMDISDGLLLDARRMADASGVMLSIDRRAVPFSAEFIAACTDPAMADAALRWGDDYELLFTLPADVTPPVDATCIGTVAGRGENALLVDGIPVDGARPLGFEHSGG